MIVRDMNGMGEEVTLEEILLVGGIVAFHLLQREALFSGS